MVVHPHLLIRKEDLFSAELVEVVQRHIDDAPYVVLTNTVSDDLDLLVFDRCGFGCLRRMFSCRLLLCIGRFRRGPVISIHRQHQSSTVPGKYTGRKDITKPTSSVPLLDLWKHMYRANSCAAAKHWSCRWHPRLARDVFGRVWLWSRPHRAVGWLLDAISCAEPTNTVVFPSSSGMYMWTIPLVIRRYSAGVACASPSKDVKNALFFVFVVDILELSLLLVWLGLLVGGFGERRLEGRRRLLFERL